MVDHVKAQLLAAGAKLPSEARKGTQERRTPVASPKETLKPAEPRTAQISATLGQPGVQIWSGVDGQGSVLRFFDLAPADKVALLALAAERGIHPTRR